jgi:hypothetical protein
MALNDKLRTETIQDLNQIDLYEIDTYAKKNKNNLSFLYNQGIIDDLSIESALEVAVLNQAIQDYNIMTNEDRKVSIYADHIDRPDCFAYALQKDIFSNTEIKRIPFDHGQTVETYTQRYGKENLLSTLREELLNPKPLQKSEKNYYPHHICSCEY